MRLRRVMLVGAAMTGLVVAHSLDYLLLIPDPSHRHDVLLRTGHGYLTLGLAIAAIAGLAAVASALALGASGCGRRRDPVVAMALVGAGGFVALEAVERLAVGARIDGTVLAVVLLGAALQVAVAFVATTILGLARLAGEVIARAGRARRAAPARPSRTRVLFDLVHGATCHVSSGGHATRAPPHLLTA